MAGKNRRRVTPSENYKYNLPLYQLYSNAVVGGRQLLRPPPNTLHPITGSILADSSYLTRLSGERIDKDGADPWYRRRSAGAHLPISSEVIDTHVDTLSRQGIDRTAVEELLPDLSGTTERTRAKTAAFFMGAFAAGLTQGWLGGLVDAPEVAAGQYPSQAHLDAAGLLPRCRLLLPRRFLRLTLDDDGRVLYALVREGKDRLGEWYPDRYTPLSPDGSELSAPVSLRLGRIPIEIFRACDPDPDDETQPPGLSAIRHVALIDLQILQHLSWIDDLITKAGFCLLHVQGDPPVQGEAEEDTVIGPGYVYYQPGEVDWKAPPAEIIDALWRHVIRMREEAYRVGGIYRRSQDMAEASSGVAIEYERAPIDNRVVRWAQNLQDWETRIWRLQAELAGRDPSGVEVTYPEDFSQLPYNADIEQASATAAIYGGYSSAPPWVREGIDAKVRRALLRDVGHVPSVRRMVSAAAKAAMMLDTDMGGPGDGQRDSMEGDDGQMRQ